MFATSFFGSGYLIAVLGPIGVQGLPVIGVFGSIGLAGILVSGFFCDWGHPNFEGYEVMAEAYYQGIISHGG